MAKLVEETEQFRHLLVVLEENGAAGPVGFTIRQDELVALAGFPSIRTLYRHLGRAKELKLLTVTAQATGGGTDLVRLPNRYRLRMTVAQWDEAAPAVIVKRREALHGRMSAKSRNAARERSRLQRAGKRAIAAGKVPVSEPIPVDVEGVEQRVARMGPDEDLRGW